MTVPDATVSKQKEGKFVACRLLDSASPQSKQKASEAAAYSCLHAASLLSIPVETLISGVVVVYCQACMSYDLAAETV